MNFISFKNIYGSTIILNKEMVVCCKFYQDFKNVDCVNITLQSNVCIEEKISPEEVIKLQNAF